MANEEHLAILRNGMQEWNAWREQHEDVRPDLSWADLHEANLREANLSRANLSRANLRRANLSGATLRRANLSGADLSDADLSEANLSRADLSWANVSAADLSRAYLSSATLSRATLSGATLRGANLSGANLSWLLSGADLSRADLSGADLSAANLSWTDLSGANLTAANLSRADLSSATLSGADLSRADLGWANLRGANLRGANLSNANLREANLREADLSNANLRGYLRGADLSGAKLIEADLSGAYLNSARVQYINLDRANITGARLWETQRAGWSLKGIICERAYWDQKGEQPTYYEPGEFERLYSEQPIIELFYQGGLTTFEINTLPALLHRLGTLHPECTIRLKSVEETAGGAKVSITIADADAETVQTIDAEAQRLLVAQIAMRDNEIVRLQIQKQLLLDDVIPRMLAAQGQHVQIAGAVSGPLVIAASNATMHAQQTINDFTAIRTLLDQVLTRREELGLASDQAESLEAAVRDVQTELKNSQPRHPVILEGLKTVKDVVINALGNAVGTAFATNTWKPMLDQVDQVVAQLLKQLGG